MIKFIIRVLLFLSKKLTKVTFVENFENLNECLNYLKKNSYIKKESKYDRYINEIAKAPPQITDSKYILSLWDLIYSEKNTVLDWGGGVTNSSFFLDSSNIIYVLDIPELINKLKANPKKNVFYISKLEEIPKEKTKDINLFYFGSSIQYLNINDVIDKISIFMPMYLVFTHNLYIKKKKTFYTIQNNVPNEQIPYCIYNYDSFINFFKKYEVIKCIQNKNPYSIKSKNYNSDDMFLASIILKRKNILPDDK